ncbi:MAG: DNA replication/repair protein RecF [Chitinophagales bacterium]
MNIKQIHLVNYKNHQNLKLIFEKNVVCFVGLNGIGKTNILDAIYYSCIGKSYFASVDKNCVNYDAQFFRLKTNFVDNEIVITYEKGKRKKINLNEVPVTKLSNYLGNFPVVVIAPDDNILILGNSEDRRKFIDQTLMQTDKKYASVLVKYAKILQQRNALLKNAEKQGLDLSLLEIYTENLIPLGNEIFKARKEFVAQLNIYFNKAYKEISLEREVLSLEYVSALTNNSFEQLLKNCLNKDRILKRTTEGVHKDDLLFLMNDSKIKSFGSQGQQKTFLLALKLAQYYYLKEKLNKATTFIIDDIFDKLDADRSKSLIKFVCENLEQVFISHTNKEMLEKSFKNFDFQLINI